MSEIEIPDKYPCTFCKGVGILKDNSFKIPIKDKNYKTINELIYECKTCKNEFTTEEIDLFNLKVNF